jgi:hypothetical protein
MKLFLSKRDIVDKIALALPLSELDSRLLSLSKLTAKVAPKGKSEREIVQQLASFKLAFEKSNRELDLISE